jgi:ABC-type uncharacterized transport system involved in gliding motility auxiliary subunit
MAKGAWQGERRTLTILGVVLAIVCFLAVNLFATLELQSDRLDLTQSRIYTLSQGTKTVLSQMKEPVTLRLYLSRALTDAQPALKPYAVRVREMLDTYAGLANGRIKLEVVDPEPFSPEEDRATGYGLRGVPFDSAGNQGYFGVVGTNSTDDTDSIPFFQSNREPFLEYDLTRLVYNLAHPEKPVVALIDGIGMAGGPQSGYRPWQVLAQMQQFFDMRTLAGDLDKIDDDVKVLLLVHPHDLSDKTLFAIDQYVLRGGHALVFLDPLAEQMMRSQQMGMPPQGVASNLDKLLKAWGVELVPGKVVGDRGSGLQVQAMSNGRDVVTQYLPWLDLGADSLDHNDAVTGELEVLRILSAGALKSTPGATTKLTPLVQSSADAALLDSEQLQLMPDPVRLLTDFKPSGERYVLAGRLSGPVKTAFPDGPPATAPAAPATGTAGATPPASPALAAFLKESKQPVSLVLVGDADMLADTSWLNVQNVMGNTLGVPIANNADFAINAVENLAGGEALVGLRGRGLSGRPFTTVEKIRDAAEAKYRATEEQLNTQLQDVQTKLASLQTDDKGASEQLLSPAQQDTIRQFRSQVLTIRGQLREVQHALRQDIDRLETRLMLANIGLVPAVVALLALVLAVWRRARASRRVRA